MSVNKVILIGRVGSDIESRHFETGSILAKFSLATTESYKNKLGERVETTDWHNINVWGNSAIYAEKYVAKGTLLFIEGRIRTTSFEDKEGNKKYNTFIEVSKIGERIEILSRKDSGDNNKSTSNQDDSPF